MPNCLSHHKGAENNTIDVTTEIAVESHPICRYSTPPAIDTTELGSTGNTPCIAFHVQVLSTANVLALEYRQYVSTRFDVPNLSLNWIRPLLCKSERPKSIVSRPRA